jgi:hypothetical protein
MTSERRFVTLRQTCGQQLVPTQPFLDCLDMIRVRGPASICGILPHHHALTGWFVTVQLTALSFPCRRQRAPSLILPDTIQNTLCTGCQISMLI